MRHLLIVTIFVCSYVAAFAQTTSTVHQGQYAVKMTNTDSWVSGADVGFQATSHIPVTAGNVLSVSFWMRDISNGRMIVFRAGEFAGGTFLQDHDLFGWPGVAAQTVWTKYEYSYTIPAGVDSITLALRPEWSGSSMALDDVSVIDQTAGNTELAPNPGFEVWSGDPLMPDGWFVFASPGKAAPTIEQLVAPPPPTPVPPTAARGWQLFQ